MISLRSEAKLSRIRAEIDALDLARVPVGAGRARGEGTAHGWISGLSMTRLVDPGRFNRLIDLPATASAIGALMRERGGTPYQVLVNRLDPGGDLDFHRDGIPFDPAPERWHLPLVTNPLVEYYEEPDLDVGVHLPAGSWSGPIHYWRLHAMRNLGDEPRTHLIVDLDHR